MTPPPTPLRIICLPDLLRGIRSYPEGFFDLVREPIRQGCGIDIGYAPGGKRPHSLANGFDLARFRALADVDMNSSEQRAQWAASHHSLPAEALDYLFAHWPAHSLVLTFEMPPWLAKACIERATPFLDIRISPLRFGRDLYIALRSSDSRLYQRIGELAVTEEELRLEAATLAANVQMHSQRLEELHNQHFQDLDGGLLFIGQMPGDASLLSPDGRSLRCADFADRLRALSEGRRLFYKGHTFALDFANNECTELAGITGQPVTACHLNAYQILSTHDDVELVGISSGLLQEAAWFGKKAHVLFQPFVPLAEEEFSADTYQQVHFRTFLSPGFWHQVLTPQCSAPRLPTLPDVTYNHARETLNLWWDYSKVMTWERQLPHESFLRGGGLAMQQRIDTLEKSLNALPSNHTHISSKESFDPNYIEFLKNRLPLLREKDIPSNFKTDQTKLDTLRYCLSTLSIPDGLVAEFGVYKGITINMIAGALQERTIHGFDSFEGFPDDGRADWQQDFSTNGVQPRVADNVILHKGYFKETLPKFSATYDGQHLAFMHIDCDLYSSTKDIFSILGTMIQPGCLIVFDELLHYGRFLQNEMLAFYEFLQERNLDFEWVAIRGKVMTIDEYFTPPPELNPIPSSMQRFRLMGYEQEVAVRIREHLSA